MHEYDQLQHQIADANTELEEAERRHSEITNPLAFRLSDIRSSGVVIPAALRVDINGCRLQTFKTKGLLQVEVVQNIRIPMRKSVVCCASQSLGLGCQTILACRRLYGLLSTTG